MISTYYLFENNLPEDVLNFGIRESGEYRDAKEYEKYRKTVLNYPEFKSPKVRKVIVKKNLVPIFAYGNGDYCFYSIKEKKYFDYSHETESFKPSKFG
jgi:hypothetical protein